MNITETFEEEHELTRLGAQIRLMRKYEIPLYRKYIPEDGVKALLDIGCNDGSKTHDIFSEFNIGKVIGIECSPKLSAEAEKKFGDEKFSFYCCDAESESFSVDIASIMRENGIEKFDLIYISLVLMHLNNASEVLSSLRSLLAENGKVIIVEAEDSLTSVSPDREGLFKEFRDVLETDPLAGDREFSLKLTKLLAGAGYNSIKSYPIKITASAGEKDIKEQIFDIYFSYAPEDFELLTEKYPDNAEYRSGYEWIKKNYPGVHPLVVDEAEAVSMGIRVVVSSVREEPGLIPLGMDSGCTLEKLSDSTVDIALELLDECVGKNLYSRSYIESVVYDPDCYFYLVRNPDNEIIAYDYFYLTDLDDMAQFTKTSRETLSAMSNKAEPVIGDIRSLGVSVKYRHHGLAVKLMQYYIDSLKKLHADLAFGAFWKINGGFPMKESLKTFDFKFLCDAHDVWYDIEELYCPVCKGRCHCDASIYYINLGDDKK